MKTSAGVLLALALAVAETGAYRTALPGYRFEFPRDHFSHPEFRTEWWYYTGNLRSADGRPFGFELTFFRHGVSRAERTNVWDVDDVWLAHLALSDIEGKRFFHAERINRGGAGMAGANHERARIWNGNWSVDWRLAAGAAGGAESMKLAAVDERFRIALELKPLKPPVIHGQNGVSQKAAGPGRASHYVSYTRLGTSGTISVEGRDFTVEGLTWMDHEFFTHQLEPDQTGWDWLSLHLDDGSDLMLFRLRRKDGLADPHSAGTYVDAAGRSRRLTAAQFTMAPGRTWTSPASGGVYPIEWALTVPSLRLEAKLGARMPQQELTSRNRSVSAYWEGSVEVSGTRGGQPLRGSGYLEMTGYAGAVRMGE